MSDSSAFSVVANAENNWVYCFKCFIAWSQTSSSFLFHSAHDITVTQIKPITSWSPILVFRDNSRISAIISLCVLLSRTSSLRSCHNQKKKKQIHFDLNFIFFLNKHFNVLAKKFVKFFIDIGFHWVKPNVSKRFDFSLAHGVGFNKSLSKEFLR